MLLLYSFYHLEREGRTGISFLFSPESRKQYYLQLDNHFHNPIIKIAEPEA